MYFFYVFAAHKVEREGHATETTLPLEGGSYLCLASLIFVVFDITVRLLVPHFSFLQYFLKDTQTSNESIRRIEKAFFRLPPLSFSLTIYQHLCHLVLVNFNKLSKYWQFGIYGAIFESSLLHISFNQISFFQICKSAL